MNSYGDFERAGWERAAATYSTSFQRATSAFAEHVLNALGPLPSGRLLDLACGPGYLSALAAARGANVVAADFAHGMVTAARHALPTLAVVRADAQRLPFASESFAAIAINFGVHHFSEAPRALSESFRVLNRGGRLAFTIWAAPTVNPVQKLVFDAIAAAGGEKPILPPPPGGSVTDGPTCRRLLREAGFASSQIEIVEVQALLSFASGRALIDMLREGTVQTAAVINAQPAERIDAIVGEVERAIERYRVGDVLRVPALALLVCAVKD